ncbi:hypothetical protein MKZ38_004270 [Zalerion maritima]|uniref:Uncharacterized protein n=1 Tax=Zalerion maritima TaxID=339359 RepID=A0AAD5WUH6_9PEZI|nr:hypothetical protein MKZ38_004270 [Zalerion maritima]
MDDKIDDDDFQKVYEYAQEDQTAKSARTWKHVLFQFAYFLVIACIAYFGSAAYPLYDGAALAFWNFTHAISGLFAGTLSFVAWPVIFQWGPLLTSLFEGNAMPEDVEKRDVSETSLVIPCYESAEMLERVTLPAALKMFPPEAIFVVASGNSETPLDATEEVCKKFGVEHVWLHHHERGAGSRQRNAGAAGAGSGVQARWADEGFRGKVWQRDFPPRSDMSLEEGTDLFLDIINGHPGFDTSEDWYLGHTARCAGYRILMTSRVFVEIEAPPYLLMGNGAGRGGFGEMAVVKQRFYRWNFFFLRRVFTNMFYIFFSWRLGFAEVGTKIWVLNDTTDYLLMIAAPLVLPCVLATSPALFFAATGVLLFFTITGIPLFNVLHLRRKNQMAEWKIISIREPFNLPSSSQQLDNDGNNDHHYGGGNGKVGKPLIRKFEGDRWISDWRTDNVFRERAFEGWRDMNFITEMVTISS